MSSCDESNITKNYIVQSPGDIDILSACTAFYTNNIYNCTGGTLTLHSDIVSANTINASVYLSGGTNILDILVSLDNFTTGATLVGSEVVFDRTDSLSAYTLDLSSLDVNDTFVTGFTYDNANTFTISDNSGTTFNATFNTVTGLTVNGGLSATTISACTGIYTSNLYGCSPITVHDNVQHISSSATGINSIAWGSGTTASGNYSHAEGLLTIASGIASHAEGGVWEKSGVLYPRPTSATTFSSHAEGINTLASGGASHAEGRGTTASGNYSHAEGDGTTASGDLSHAEGAGTSAIGSTSHAEGYNTTASGYYSHAEGDSTTASGYYSHAEGYNTTASGGYASHAEGGDTTASGYYSHAEGNGTTASGNYSHAEGNSTTASGYYSHAEGIGTTSSGNYGSHAEGKNTTSSGYGSHAEGKSTTASGNYSHSQGIGTIASGDYSHASGKSFIPSTPGHMIVASGDTSFVHFNQTAKNGILGAFGDYSTILGGNDHNIGTGSTSSGIFAGFGNTISNDVTNSVIIGGSNITGTTSDTVYVPNLNIGTSPLDNTLTQILSRDGSDGTIKYRDVASIISAATSQDTYVTGFTYDDINAFTISDNSGTTFTASINILSATTISATTFYGDGSNLSGIPHTTDTFVSGGTYSDITDIITFTNTTGGTFNVTGITDTFITGMTFNTSTYDLTIGRNDGEDITDSLAVLASDVYVLSGVYSASTGIVTYTNSTGGTFQVSGFTTGMTDSYTVSANLNSESIEFVNNIQTPSPFYSVSLTPLLSGKTNVSLFNSYTSDTQTILDSKISGATNLTTTGLFAQKNGENLEFKGITSTGGTVTITNDSTRVNLEVTIPPDDNTFITGFTYDDINAFTITDNLGTAFTASINVLSATTISGGTFYGDGSNLTGISTENTTITGYTYNDANTFTISDSSGSTFDASINIMTGLTINGDLNVNGESVFSGSSTDVVQIYGSGSTTPIFRIQGSSGELFSVTDSLVGELFAVNDISGIPILQVHSDNRIILGDNVAPSLYTTAKVTATSGSLTSIYSVPVSAYTGAWFEYTAKGTTSLRAGNIASIFSGTSVSHNETTTTDIGDTSDLLLDVIISGTSATLTASATTSNWEIKTIIRSI